MELKKTLLMPKTSFEMRGNLNVKEPIFLTKWHELNLYQEMLKSRKGAPEYSLHDGPPYANGNIHCGHMLNRLLKDFIVRYKHMSGFYVPFVFGWDTHGLPIENQVTKQGVNRKTTPIVEFRQKCREYALKQVAIQKEQIKRLGVIGDFDNPYVTLDRKYEARQIEVFAKMALQGLIFKGLKPVYWSPSSESALAEAEIEYYDVTSPSIYVSFEVSDGKNVLERGDKLVIWTTTPWTLPANLAISVHPRFEYGLYHTEKGRFVILVEFKDRLQSELGFKNMTLIKTIKGQELEKVMVQHPFYDRLSMVLNGEHVTNEAGTGLVHTAPGHGVDDYNVCQKYDIAPYCPVDDRGFMTSEAGERLAGLFYEEANKVVVEMLKENDALLKYGENVHSYPHDWRTKKPLIFRATPQWFCSIEPIRANLLAEVKKVHWVPSWGEVRMVNMIKDRADWCISRQRAWGVPIPILYCEDQTPIIEKEVFDYIIKLIAEHGSDVWYEKEAKDLLPPGYKNSHSPNGVFTKEKDIMDVWFDSGSSFNGVLKDRGLKFPADLYIEGNDQYRGWFNSSLTIATACFKTSPFKDCVTHGFVVDENWDKMSKSKGNGIDPSKVANQFGADILRLWAATIDYKQDVRISESIIMQVAEVYRKVRNTFKFLLGNLANGEDSSFDLSNDKVETFELIDTFILAELERVKNDAINAFEKYDFGNGISRIVTFMSRDLSAFYLDITKDILYCDSRTSLRRKQVQNVIYQVTDTLMRLLTPFVPFTMDEIYHSYGRDHLANVQLLDYPVVSNNYPDVVIRNYESFMNLRDEVLKKLEEARSASLIGSSQEATILLDENNEVIKKLKMTNNPAELARLFVVSKVDLSSHQEIVVSRANGQKCPRCWNYVDQLHAHEEHMVCSRCNAVLKEKA
ncbi:MAG: isoleucine--tRNA ligase [Bacilli bacterium]|jgi:isoleucyl-tRNA synthetase